MGAARQVCVRLHSAAGLEGPGSGSPFGGPQWSRRPGDNTPAPRKGSAWPPSGQQQCPSPVHSPTPTLAPAPPAHTRLPSPTPQREMWRRLTRGSNRQLRQDVVSRPGCGGRMRYQTLRSLSRSRGGAGEGLSPRPRLLLPGRLRLEEGSPRPVTCQHPLPLAAPGSHSLTPSLSPQRSHHLTAGGGHPGRRTPGPAETGGTSA